MISQTPPKQMLSYLFKMVQPFSLGLGIMFWVAIFWAIDLSIRPYLLKVILNGVASGDPQNVFDYLTKPVMLYCGMYILMATSYRLYDYFVHIRMIPPLRKRIATEALAVLVNKSHHYYQNNFSGSLANKINNLTDTVPQMVQIIIDRFFSHGLALLLAMITLWQVSGWFALSMMIWSLLFIIGSFLFSRHLKNLALEWSEMGSIITGKMVDTLSNILSVRLFTGKKKEKEALSATFQTSVKAEQDLGWAYFWMWVYYGYSFAVLQIFNFYFLLKGRQEGWITVGDFALVLVINISIIDFLWQLARDFAEFSKHWGRVSQALRIVWDTPSLSDKPGAKPLKITKGRIEFDRVTFHYRGSKALFQNLSVTIEAGQKVGLVGYSGGGKTSFVNLILRLYEVTEGHIRIDDQDIKEVIHDSLYSPIAMIPQDPSLFHRTLRENIAYGSDNPSFEAIVTAAKRAHAHEFIIKLPEGYEALVGERGVKLSGGQRQRIAIARAILKNAPILILDEATSQLDSLTENDIQESLWHLMQGKTTIVIAHRLSTLLQMDRILVFDQGKIVEDGPHTELLAKKGLYRTMWDAQMGGLLPDHA